LPKGGLKKGFFVVFFGFLVVLLVVDLMVVVVVVVVGKRSGKSWTAADPTTKPSGRPRSSNTGEKVCGPR
jgi:Na+-transporting methylmalonyl-CoA/oxaloacetate decarboxylase gamma subunit